MSFIVAISGKGGTGKTTFAALLIKEAIERGIKPLLAVDADPNYNLGDALGMKPDTTIADVTDMFFRDRISLPPGMSKESYLELRLSSAIVEGDDIDLVVMGRPEGPGCYCYLNNVLKAFLERLEDNYRMVVIDNEAGMEHISRRITPRLDMLIAVSDPSIKGIRAAKRIEELARELGLAIDTFGLVLSRAGGALSERLREEVDKLQLPLLGIVPCDPEIEERDIEGHELLSLNGSSPAVSAVSQIAQNIFQLVKDKEGKR